MSGPTTSTSSATGISYTVDDIVRPISHVLNARIVDSESMRATRERPTNPDVIDLVLQARSLNNLPPTPGTASFNGLSCWSVPSSSIPSPPRHWPGSPRPCWTALVPPKTPLPRKSFAVRTISSGARSCCALILCLWCLSGSFFWECSVAARRYFRRRKEPCRYIPTSRPPRSGWACA